VPSRKQTEKTPRGQTQPEAQEIGSEARGRTDGEKEDRRQISQPETHSSHSSTPTHIAPTTRTHLQISIHPHALIDQAQEVKDMELLPVVPNGENDG
jgi:hypothetical protein